MCLSPRAGVWSNLWAAPPPAAPSAKPSLGFRCYINFSGSLNPAKSLLRLLGNETQHCLDLPALLGGRFGIAPKPPCSCPASQERPGAVGAPELRPGMLQGAELGLSALKTRARTFIQQHSRVNSQLSRCCWRSLSRWDTQSAPSRVSLRFSCPKAPCPTFSQLLCSLLRASGRWAGSSLRRLQF